MKKIHKFRVLIKQTRTLLRLARFSINHKTFKTIDRSLRQQGQKYSQVRNAQVDYKIWKRLKYKDRIIARYLKRNITKTKHQLSHRQSCPKVMHLHLKICLKKSHLKQSLSHTYIKGRKLFHLALNKPTPTHLHNWRKQIKYLFYMISEIPETSLKHSSNVKKNYCVFKSYSD